MSRRAGPGGAPTTQRLTRPARSEPGRRPRRGTPDATRERLIAAAAEVFNRDGYFGTDSNALARAAGYSPATFYKHFVDKRAILLAAYAQWVVGEWDHIGALLRARATDGAGRGRAQLAAELTAWIVAHHRRWRGLRASVLALVGSDKGVRDFYLAQRRNQLELLERLRGRAPRPGEREADAVLLFTFERVCDGLAGGEAKALGLDAAELEALLVAALESRL